MESTCVRMPPLEVSICIDSSNTRMPDGTFSTTFLLPTRKQKMIIAQVQGNNFQIPATELELEVGPGICTKLSPCISIRVTAPGNKIMNPSGPEDSSSPNLQQHMFTVYADLQKLMYTIYNGSVYHIKFQTQEDNRHYDLYISPANSASVVKDQVQDCLKKLSMHVQNLQRVHGMKLMTVADAVNACNKGREERWSILKRASSNVFGNEDSVVEWFLCMNRMFSGLRIDIAQSNYMRKHAVMLNPEFNMTMLMLICGGILSEIVNNSNTVISCESSVRNQVEVWCTQPQDVIKQIFITHIVRHNATTSAYLSDAGWDNNGQTLICSKEPKEDQLPFAGFPFESILNHALFGVSLKLGDCEDLSAMIQGILDLYEIPREEFYRLIITSLQMIPIYFNNSKAASDYTVHQDSYKTLGLKLWQVFQSGKYENTSPLNTVDDIFNQAMKGGTESMTYENSVASILAKASRIDQTVNSFAQADNHANMSLKTYTKQWQSSLAKQGPEGTFQGHACVMHCLEKHLGTIMNMVDVHEVKNIKILESTSNARQNPPLPAIEAFFGDNTRQREMLTNTLGGKIVLPQTLTSNIESSLRSFELASKMPKETGVFASQTFSLGSNNKSEFYELKLQTNGCAVSVQRTKDGVVSVPGHSLNSNLGAMGLRVSTPIQSQEREGLEILGSIGSMFTLSLETMSKNGMLPQLVPLTGRQPLTISTGGEMKVAPPASLQTTSMNTGCVIKQLYKQNQLDIGSFAKEVAQNVSHVLKTDTNMIMGPFVGGVILEAPL